MSLESAEMVKYASNTFLAMKISYANEMARICERVPGVDVSKVMAGVGLDERINPKFLNAGAGFGGSCLPKDTKALCTFAEAQGYSAPLLRATLAVNQAQASHVAQLALVTLGEPRDKKWPSSASLSSPRPMTCARPHPSKSPAPLDGGRARQSVRSRGQAGKSARL